MHAASESPRARGTAAETPVTRTAPRRLAGSVLGRVGDTQRAGLHRGRSATLSLFVKACIAAALYSPAEHTAAALSSSQGGGRGRPVLAVGPLRDER